MNKTPQIHIPVHSNKTFCSSDVCEINDEETTFEEVLTPNAFPDEAVEMIKKLSPLSLHFHDLGERELLNEFVDCSDEIESPCAVQAQHYDSFISNDLEFDDQHITGINIQKASSLITQIACVNLSYSTYKCTSDHACSLCQKSPLKAIADFFINNNMDDLKNTKCGASIDVLNPCEEIQSIINTQKTFENSIIVILQTLAKNMRLRLTELIIGVIFYERLLKWHWECSVFVLFRQSLKTLFLACVIIAHKLSTDCVFNNLFFSKLFNINLSTLKEFENGCLSLLDFDLNIDPKQYEAIRKILI